MAEEIDMAALNVEEHPIGDMEIDQSCDANHDNLANPEESSGNENGMPDMEVMEHRAISDEIDESHLDPSNQSSQLNDIQNTDDIPTDIPMNSSIDFPNDIPNAIANDIISNEVVNGMESCKVIVDLGIEAESMTRVHANTITDSGVESIPSVLPRVSSQNTTNSMSQSTQSVTETSQITNSSNVSNVSANPVESDESKHQNYPNDDNSQMDKPQMVHIEMDSENEQKYTQTLVELDPHHGHCSKQGFRNSMEDEVVVEPNYTVLDSTCTSGHLSLYAVFDGHGGDKCAAFCAHHLLSILSKYLQTCSTVETAFMETMRELDGKAIAYSDDASGSTCCIVLIDRRRLDLWCCNVGDSRCILINEGYDAVKQLSVEHKPHFAKEKERIEKANGWVTYGRVCGILAVSRSLGDKDFKFEIKDLIVSTPDVTHHKVIIDHDRVIVLACDGLYDVFSNEQCMEWMKENNTPSMTTQKLTDKLCNDAIYVRKSRDNVSILIIRLDHREVDVVEINRLDPGVDPSVETVDTSAVLNQNDVDNPLDPNEPVIDTPPTITPDPADSDGQEASRSTVNDQNDLDNQNDIQEITDNTHTPDTIQPTVPTPMGCDEIKEEEDIPDKRYNSISSTTTSIASITSVGASITEDVEESLNESLSSGQSREEVLESMSVSVSPKKHKFIVTIEPEDDVMDIEESD